MELPPLPEGFTVDAPQDGSNTPPLPAGFTLDGAPKTQTPKTEEPTDLGRQIALLGRAAGEGVTDTLASPYDALVVTPGNYMVKGINKLLGTKFAETPMTSQVVSDLLDKAGAYHPETPAENYASAATRGVSGALTGVGALGALTAANPATTANIIRGGVSGATSAGSSEYARQHGLSPLWQSAFGLAGGLTPAVAEGAARLTPNIMRPLTQSGQEDMAANIMGNQVSDPERAIANLKAAQEIVPGSARNAGEASQDAGLLTLEKGVRNRNTTDFANRISEQNSARQSAMTNISGTEADIARAQSSRDARTGAMREQSLGSGGNADVSPVLDHIDSVLAGPIGQRDVPAQALGWLKNKLLGDTETSQTTTTVRQKVGPVYKMVPQTTTKTVAVPITDPAKLYAIRQDINDAIAGKLGGEESKFRLASGQLIQVRDVLDDAIERAAPGFKDYLKTYSGLSKPINQMEIIQEIAKRAAGTVPDPITELPILGNASFSRALDSALTDNPRVLTPRQIDTLNAIKRDLQAGQAVNSGVIKAPGSDTFQNLSIAQSIGAGLSNAHPMLRALTQPLNWIYKKAGSDDKVNEILSQAMLDPKFAASLLEKASPQNLKTVSDKFRSFMTAPALGTLASIHSQQNHSSALERLKKAAGITSSAEDMLEANTQLEKNNYASGGMVNIRLRQLKKKMSIQKYDDGGPVESNSPNYAKNSAYAVSGPYQTVLTPEEEKGFEEWIKSNHIPFDPSETSDYDMRGFYKGLKDGDPNAKTALNANDGKMHFSDFWKTPYHESFSAESKYATQGAPNWNSKNQLVLPDGTVVFDEPMVYATRKAQN